MDCGPPGPSVYGISHPIRKQVAISFSKTSRSRDRTCISYISCTGRQILYHGTIPQDRWADHLSCTFPPVLKNIILLPALRTLVVNLKTYMKIYSSSSYFLLTPERPVQNPLPQGIFHQGPYQAGPPPSKVRGTHSSHPLPQLR